MPLFDDSDAELSDVGPTDGPHWLKHLPLKVGSEVVAPNGSASRILVRDTWNTEIVGELAPVYLAAVPPCSKHPARAIWS